MISFGKHRPSFQITIADIFQDYNGQRKELLVSRVQLALEEQDRRMKKQIETNNLANLQILLKKQFIVKQLEETIESKNEEIQEFKARLAFSSHRIQTLQDQLAKYSEMNRLADQKLKSARECLMNLEGIVKTKDSVHQNLQKQRQHLIADNQRLEDEKKKYESLINSLRLNYNRKLEQTQLVLKIKQTKMQQEFEQNLQHIKTHQALEKCRKQIDHKLNIKRSETKHQKIQCNLFPKQSPRKSVVQRAEIGIQTEETKDKMISELIDQSEEKNSKNQDLNEVRLIYTTNSRQRQAGEQSPRLTKYLNIIRQQKETQTQTCKRPEPLKRQQNVKKIEKENREIQVNLNIEDSSMEQKLRRYKKQLDQLRYTNKQNHAYDLIEVQNSELRLQVQKKEDKIKQLSLKILQQHLQIDKQRQTMTAQRDFLLKTNKRLETSQNELMIRKVIRDSQLIYRRPKMTKTCSFIYDHSNKKSLDESHVTTNDKTAQKDGLQETLQGTPGTMTPSRWGQQEADIINVIKKGHELKLFKVKRHSVTESSPSQQATLSDFYIPKNNYRKYSQVKKK